VGHFPPSLSSDGSSSDGSSSSSSLLFQNYKNTKAFSSKAPLSLEPMKSRKTSRCFGYWLFDSGAFKAKRKFKKRSSSVSIKPLSSFSSRINIVTQPNIF
jgi:hypothetical protein